ncbi:hydrogenase nickel incorporation protein HypA/HybF [Nocardioides sp. J9]|uniref:hydrogenase maturation nickel metallochaperone HypA/HybF n=1 Tax=Nocardioides sp. J9 TaxID=935844 RepID=UPI0011A8BAC9|nr:hydrogenase maturation nickel metallochaperone HypA [Nocardioides sp. J9]TWG92777.1 hydrogenase nickel incorporation protein HypA/HybF [Nocardioides sp. J9]
MHELSLCRTIHQVVEKAAGDRKVAAVHLKVGKLRQVIPGTLTYCWGLVSADGPLAGSQLVVESVSVVGNCRSCGRDTEVEQVLVLVCAHCGAAALDIVSGEEFLITTIDLDDRTPAARRPVS